MRERTSITELWSDRLYIGDFYSAYSPGILQKHNINAIINMAQNIPSTLEQFPSITLYKFGLYDDSASQHLNQPITYALAAYTALQLINDGKRVLIHCRAGISRSTSICALLWAFDKRVPIDIAESMIKQKRPIVSILDWHKDNLQKALEILFSWTHKPFPEHLKETVQE